MYRYRLLTLLMLLSLVPSLCTAGQRLTPLDDRPAAPAFRLSDSHGKQVMLSDYRGEVLVVNFWASWCPPCVREMDSMQRGAGWLARNGGRFIAINMGERPEEVAKFLAGREFKIQVLLDVDSSVSDRWGVRGLPSTFVVDPEGRLVYQALGAREWDDPALLVPLRALSTPKR